MIMKMHSYMAVNGYLKHISVKEKATLEQLRKATESVGGWDKAIQAARDRRAEIDSAATAYNTSDGSGMTTPEKVVSVSGTTTSYVDVTTAAALRQRLVSAAAAQGDEEKATLPTPASPSYSSPPLRIHPLVDHPDEKISEIANKYTDMRSELVSAGPAAVQWPENITFKNFAVYQLIPTLVYDLEYPRTDRISPLYVFEKTVATFGTFALLYTVTESFILPMTPTPEQSFFRSLLDLAFPFMIAYLLLFYIIFECICNWFAEISYFADRQFYEDWWNSTSWDEFSRKWNKPVHTFLLRHVYSSTIKTYKISRTSAMFITFLLSAAAHEMVMVVVTQKIRLYLFWLQLVQIPLIVLSRLPAIKSRKRLGNVIFWLGLYAGFPLLCVAYVAY
jgi:sterol O-acyltransferase